MLKKLIGLVIVFVMALTVFDPPVSHAEVYQYATVTADRLNVRANPDQNAAVIGKFKQNEQVKWIKNENGWTKVVYGNTTGWVSSAYLSISAKSGTATGSSINVRNAASMDGDIISKLNKGTEVAIQSETADWYYIQCAGIKGWVSKQFIALSSASGSAVSQSTAQGVKPGNTYYVDATKLNVRSIASSEGKILGKLTTNDIVTVTGTSGNWASINYGNTVGWVGSQYLSVDKKSTEGTVQQPEERITLLKKSNIRTGPGTHYGILTTSDAGTVYTVIGSEKDWYKLRMPNGQTGWIASWLVGSADANIQAPSNSSAGLKGKTIVLDAGHGGKDPGTSGLTYKEKTLALGTTLLTADLLKSAGANVILTRDDDTFLSLDQRVNISNSQNTDAFVSVHYNSGTSYSSGVITFYNNNGKDKALASAIQQGIINATGQKNNGTCPADYYVLKHNTKPAVLVELGFLSNPNEELLIGTKSSQQKSAQGIYRGLADYFN